MDKSDGCRKSVCISISCKSFKSNIGPVEGCAEFWKGGTGNPNHYRSMECIPGRKLLHEWRLYARPILVVSLPMFWSCRCCVKLTITWHICSMQWMIAEWRSSLLPGISHQVANIFRNVKCVYRPKSFFENGKRNVLHTPNKKGDAARRSLSMPTVRIRSSRRAIDFHYHRYSLHLRQQRTGMRWGQVSDTQPYQLPRGGVIG